MKYEISKMFEKRIEKFITDEQKAMQEVVTFFKDEFISKIPDFVNLKLYDLSYWISKNYNELNRLNELFDKKHFVNDCFQNFCEDSFELGEDFLREKGVKRDYLASSSKFLYVTNYIKRELLEELKSTETDWLYIEHEVIGAMSNYDIYDVNSIQKSPQEIKNFMFEAFSNEFDDKEDEAVIQLEDFFEEHEFWTTFKCDIEYTNAKSGFLSLVEVYKELDNFKKSSIVEFLYYLENEVQMEYDFSDEIKKEKFKEGFEIIENLLKKEVGLKEIVMKNTEKILSSLNAC